MKAYHVRDWKNFENHRTRVLHNLRWVMMPTGMDDTGYVRLVAGDGGAANLGVWLAIVQIASRGGPERRGWLVDSGGVALDVPLIASISRLPQEAVRCGMDRLLEIGWLEELEYPGEDAVPSESAAAPSRAESERESESVVAPETCAASTGEGRVLFELCQEEGGPITRITDKMVREIYAAYPRHVGRAAAFRAIERALMRLRDRGIPNPHQWLLQRVERFARTPKGQSGQYCPYPATWFNQGRYDDDPTEWGDVEEVAGKLNTEPELSAESLADFLGIKDPSPQVMRVLERQARGEVLTAREEELIRHAQDREKRAMKQSNTQ